MHIYSHAHYIHIYDIYIYNIFISKRFMHLFIKITENVAENNKSGMLR